MEKDQTSPSTIDAVNLLSDSELFCDVDSSVLEHLSSELELVRIGGGETLMKEKEPGDCMYTVTSGRLHAFVTFPDGEEQLVGEIGSGESVGEMALITGEDRSATVRAVRDTNLVKISKSGFERVVRKHPEALMQIANVIVVRLRRMLRSPIHISPLKTIAVLPAGTETPLGQFSQQLVEALSVDHRTLHLNSRRMDKYIERNQSDTKIMSWLSDQEADYRFVVYEADSSVSSWSQRCIRQADRIFLVASSESSSNMNEVEKCLYEMKDKGISIPTELVLLHKEGTEMPVGTKQWLTKRPITRHHHLCLSEQADIERLARFISGRAIGLVLGGGGSRGFAHIGVIRALTEEKIPIDSICGVSIGSIISAQYAMGWDYEKMIEMCKKGLVESKARSDRTLPIVAMSSGRRFESALKMFYDDTQIEDLWLNYFCVSCNLSTAETVVHRTGKLNKAVRASNAAPVIFPPSVQDGHLLVDGGIVNNQPGDIMKGFCGGPVIVVNVSPERDMTIDSGYTKMPSSWDILWSRLNPRRKAINVPNIPAMMMRTIMVGSYIKSKEVEKKADFYMHPPISHFKLGDDEKIDEIVDVGYKHAKEEIRKWKESHRI